MRGIVHVVTYAVWLHPFLLMACTGCRLLGCVAVVFVCWDIKLVFYAIWSPFTWFVGYSDPRKPNADLLHGQHPVSYLRTTLWPAYFFNPRVACLELPEHYTGGQQSQYHKSRERV